jgi:4-amino-4-deoxy-L-arabinose transferase-like glycosyltransferase
MLARGERAGAQVMIDSGYLSCYNPFTFARCMFGSCMADGEAEKGIETETRTEAPGRSQAIALALLALLTIFHLVNNWLWLSENVTWTGWDRPRHLAWSLNYAAILDDPSLQALFEVMVSDPIRPPFFAASAAITYKLFGRSADVATMVNIVYMAIALAATYGIGQRWGGRRLGLVSTVLLAFFPMFYTMSRHFYLEFAMTAMLALTVYLLLATDGFRRRGTSLLFGLSLGLGLLTKRTFAVFILLPVIVAILNAGLLPAAWQRLKQRPRIHWKNALVALFGGLAVAALWYLPNREAVRELILGDALFLLWWGLAGLAIYFATLPLAPLANALAAAFLAAGLASTWYLARIEFMQRMALFAYGINDPRGRALRLDSLDTYLYYMRKLGNEHLSTVVLAVMAIVLAAAVVAYVRRQGSVGQALRQVRPEGWVVLAWAVGGYAFLSLSIYQETRAFTPALPAVALIFGAALLKLPWKRLSLALLALLVAFGLLQFCVLTYEPVHNLLPPSRFELPIWGRTTSFAQGTYIQLPDEGPTDRGYWIEPDVLQRMEEQRQALGQKLLSLGLLVNTSQINTGPFNYLILTEYPQLRVEGLIDRLDETSPYARLFAHDYVLVKRENGIVNAAQQQVIDALLDGPPPLFEQIFEMETTYTLPDGDSVILYRKRSHLPADYPVEYVTRLAEALGERTRTGDAIILAPPELAGPFVSSYGGPAEVYAIAGTEKEVAEIAAQHCRLFLVLGDEEAGEVESQALDWLNENAFRAAHEWSDSLQLLVYGAAIRDPATGPSVESGAIVGGAASGERIQLVGYSLPPGPWRRCDIVPLTLFWQRQAPLGEDYQVFVHLLDEHGQLVTQSDSAPAGGSRPTSSWGEGEVIVDRHGVLLGDELAPGTYELRVGMYLPTTGERLPVQDAAGKPLGDSLSLGTVEVTTAILYPCRCGPGEW